ncbi:hypothetical protein CFC21_101941, partial [Triticum aestivum]
TVKSNIESPRGVGLLL